MPRYTVEQFIKAIPGSGGAITPIAKKVGCDWHTAKKWIEDHPTLKRAFEGERHGITDKARYNVVKAIIEGDLQTSKWWLQVMDDEFIPKQQVQGTGQGGAIPIEIREVVVKMPGDNAANDAVDDE